MLSLRNSRRRLSTLTASANLPFRALSLSLFHPVAQRPTVTCAHIARAMTANMLLAFLLRVVGRRRTVAVAEATDRHLRRLSTVSRI